MATKILHIADPHVDSPLRGLAKYPGLPDDELRSATRRAFANAVSFAIQEAVDLVLIAGDLFDGTWRDMGTGLWAVDQFSRLREAEIPVGFIRGNHDALSKVAPKLNWPENVFEFGANAAETWTLENIGVAVHGQSFATQAEERDLAAAYPAAIPNLFNIGLLHTSLAGSPDHDTYAPTSTQTLQAKGYDYWALGHIHLREIIEGPAPIVFAGNLQGRHVRETGPKGASLLTVEDRRLVSHQFIPLDVVRWQRADITVHEDDSLDDVLSNVHLELANLRAAADERPIAVRVELAGIAGCHDELSGAGQVAELTNSVRSMARDHDDVWIEKVRVRTSPPVDIDSLRKSDGLLAALFDDFERLQKEDDALSKWNVGKQFKPLINQAIKKDVSLRDCGIDVDSADDQRRWLAEAEAILLATLAGEGE